MNFQKINKTQKYYATAQNLVLSSFEYIAVLISLSQKVDGKTGSCSGKDNRMF